MKLITFDRGDQVARPGLLACDSVYDLSGSGVRSVLDVIEGGASALEALATVSEKVQPDALETVRLLAPIPRPPRVFGIGLNYAEHAAESKMKVQDVPTVFLKLSSVVGPGGEVILPKNASQNDYEAELGVVIGKAGY